jgi:hypothetical protein
LHLLVRTAELGHAACSVSFLPVVWWLLFFLRVCLSCKLWRILVLPPIESADNVH